jgi:hypothetical protein
VQLGVWRKRNVGCHTQKMEPMEHRNFQNFSRNDFVVRQLRPDFSPHVPRRSAVLARTSPGCGHRSRLADPVYGRVRITGDGRSERAAVVFSSRFPAVR